MIDNFLSASLGILEVAVILLIILVIFGPRKIGELFRSLKDGKKELEKSIKDDNGEKDK